MSTRGMSEDVSSIRDVEDEVQSIKLQKIQSDTSDVIDEVLSIDSQKIQPGASDVVDEVSSINSQNIQSDALDVVDEVPSINSQKIQLDASDVVSSTNLKKSAISAEECCTKKSEAVLEVQSSIKKNFIIYRKLVDADDETSSCGNHSDEMTLSDSDPKDSGIDTGGESQIPPSDLPDPETARQIRETLESYMSDSNLLKDPFLLKHVRRNKEGFVSLKLLASFRRVRSLSRSWKAVAYSVQGSSLLALNEEGTKVRRVSPLPDYDETVTSRSVIVSGFQTDKPSVDTIGEMFAECGDIALVRILRPRGSIPSDVKRFLSRNVDYQNRVCALVEFEEYAAARKALETARVPAGISVVTVAVTNTDVSAPKDAFESPKKKKKNRKGSDATEEKNSRTRRCSSGSVSSQSSSGYLSSSPNVAANIFDSKYPRRHSFNPAIYNDPNSSFRSLNNRHQQGSRDRIHRRSCTESSGTLSPWRRRREQMSDSNLSSASSLPQLLTALPVKTVRAPRGPDGTNGFASRTARLPITVE